MGTATTKSKSYVAKEVLKSDSKPLPYLLIHHEVDMKSPAKNVENIYAFRTEAFAPIFAVASIKGGENNADVFAPMALDFCHKYLFGSLSASVTIHPSLVDSESAKSVVDNLRYGTVVVNGWTAFAYGQMDCTWGAYPGEDINNVESGIDVVHNCKMLKGVEKTIMRFPFRNGYQVDQRKELNINPILVRSMADFFVKPGLLNFLGMYKAGFIAAKQYLLG